ncbi:MAG: translesion error-prone DNA polymerase V subunit UmuC [SAR86 cluster bacterium]|nr:translesion error-prone DNA polymerase V subunit UmuC [SAR86 cluster bacterium]
MTYALVDCNSFYASCERVFRPDLKDTPIVVLSNNDGCVVALSKEAKNIGIKMCEPWFKIKNSFANKGGVAFSSNYELYADISARVMQTLEHLAPRIEIYSIDEAFLDLSGVDFCTDLDQFGHECQEKVKRWTGMPVRVGIGPTKTLAKAASYGAKKYTATQGVVDLSKQERQRKLMSIMPVEEIWGVGSRLKAHLNRMGITTALDLADTDTKLIRRRFSIVLERTVMELKGYPCIGLEEHPSTKKEIVVSRTFGKKVTTLESINEAVSDYAARASEKLRREKQYCKVVSVFARTNPFRLQDQQYSNILSCKLSSPTNDTRDILHATKMLSRRVYKKGYNFIKAGVMLSDFYDKDVYQSDFFIPNSRRPKSERLMKTIDKINATGESKITFAAQGIKKPWSMQRHFQSPKYTTNWNDLLVVK